MMANDLIILEFSNADRSEVRLKVGVFQEIEYPLVALLQDFALQQFQTEITAEIFLVALERSSLRAGLRVILRKGREEVTHTPVASTAGAVAIIAALYKLISATGIAGGYFNPTEPISPEHQELIVSVGEQAAQNRAIIGNVEQMTSTALRAGASRVEIIFPDAPACELTNEGSGHPRHFGSRAQEVDPNDQHSTERELTLSGRTVRAALHGELRDLPVGTIKSGSRNYVVVVDWRSTERLPEAGQPITIKGSLLPLSSANLVPQPPMSMDDRSISALLMVDGVWALR